MKVTDLRISQLDRAITNGPAMMKHSPVPAGGWLKAVRTALAVPMHRVAARSGIATTGVVAAEHGEKAGTISLNQLRKLAAAMDCELVYGLVPRQSLAQLIEKRAEEIAQQQIQATSHSMALEEQGTSRAFQRKLKEDTKRKLMASPRKLWRYK